MKKTYYPLGSVLTLKKGVKRLMIVGRCQQLVQDDQVYDYAGVLWPQGVIDSQHFYVFNHEDIDVVHAQGYSDEQEEAFLDYIDQQRT